MTDRTPLDRGQGHHVEASSPVPASRPLSQFSSEWVGDDVILFDPELNRYHTLNRLAYDVWRLCDGSRTVGLIAGGSDWAEGDVTMEAVELAVAQLGESGLLQAPETAFEASLHRRKVVKLVAAGVIGAVGIPIVASITRVGPEASATEIVQCPDGVTTCNSTDCCCCHPPDKGGTC
ncbi:MAG TPA: PqqD family protein, partial [Thermomicrobiales bacterium]|nr:PqqD family protein [Thermomicrobiales bacterium]